MPKNAMEAIETGMQVKDNNEGLIGKNNND
jgi:hypothetical protein